MHWGARAGRAAQAPRTGLASARVAKWIVPPAPAPLSVAIRHTFPAWMRPKCGGDDYGKRISQVEGPRTWHRAPRHGSRRDQLVTRQAARPRVTGQTRSRSHPVYPKIDMAGYGGMETRHQPGKLPDKCTGAQVAAGPVQKRGTDERATIRTDIESTVNSPRHQVVHLLQAPRKGTSPSYQKMASFLRHGTF